LEYYLWKCFLPRVWEGLSEERLEPEVLLRHLQASPLPKEAKGKTPIPTEDEIFWKKRLALSSRRLLLSSGHQKEGLEVSVALAKKKLKELKECKRSLFCPNQPLANPPPSTSFSKSELNTGEKS